MENHRPKHTESIQLLQPYLPLSEQMNSSTASQNVASVEKGKSEVIHVLKTDSMLRGGQLVPCLSGQQTIAIPQGIVPLQTNVVSYQLLYTNRLY